MALPDVTFRAKSMLPAVPVDRCNSFRKICGDGRSSGKKETMVKKKTFPARKQPMGKTPMFLLKVFGVYGPPHYIEEIPRGIKHPCFY